MALEACDDSDDSQDASTQSVGADARVIDAAEHLLRRNCSAGIGESLFADSHRLCLAGGNWTERSRNGTADRGDEDGGDCEETARRIGREAGSGNDGRECILSAAAAVCRL